MNIISRQEAREAGLRFYFTGKQCKYGHVSPRYTSRKQCVECNKERSARCHAEYREKNRKKINDYQLNWIKNKYQKNNYFRLNRNMSKAIWTWLKRDKGCEHWEELVCFSLDELKQYLESQFDDKMNWDNYGSYWHVDHIKPVSLCDTFAEAWQLSNLQPLEATKNLSKGNRYIG